MTFEPSIFVGIDDTEPGILMMDLRHTDGVLCMA